MYTPFPPMIAKISAASAEASCKKNPRGDHQVRDVAGYLLPNGILRTAYDLYTPNYPEGAVPGLCDADYRFRHYLNDTSGYDAVPSNFRPASEILREAPEWANPCLAVLPGDTFLIARTEEDLALALAGQTGAERVSVRLIGLDGSEPPKMLLMLPGHPGLLAFAANTAEDLIGALEKRFARKIDAGEDPKQAILDFLTPAHANGVKWVLAESPAIQIAPEQDFDMNLQDL